VRTPRVATAIRFEAETHEALKETAAELGVGMNWLVNKLCEEGLARMDLTDFSLVRSRSEA
jgi:hypothetical protein